MRCDFWQYSQKGVLNKPLLQVRDNLYSQRNESKNGREIVHLVEKQREQEPNERRRRRRAVAPFEESSRQSLESPKTPKSSERALTYMKRQKPNNCPTDCHLECLFGSRSSDSWALLRIAHGQVWCGRGYMALIEGRVFVEARGRVWIWMRRVVLYCTCLVVCLARMPSRVLSNNVERTVGKPNTRASHILLRESLQEQHFTDWLRCVQQQLFVYLSPLSCISVLSTWSFKVVITY